MYVWYAGVRGKWSQRRCRCRLAPCWTTTILKHRLDCTPSVYKNPHHLYQPLPRLLSATYPQ